MITIAVVGSRDYPRLSQVDATMLHPVLDDHGFVRDNSHHLVHPNRDRPRPRWEHLDTLQQGVWRSVAEEAARVLSDAMGAT